MSKLEWLGVLAIVLLVVGWMLWLPALAIVGGCVGTGMFIRWVVEEL